MHLSKALLTSLTTLSLLGPSIASTPNGDDIDLPEVIPPNARELNGGIITASDEDTSGDDNISFSVNPTVVETGIEIPTSASASMPTAVGTTSVPTGILTAPGSGEQSDSATATATTTLASSVKGSASASASGEGLAASATPSAGADSDSDDPDSGASAVGIGRSVAMVSGFGAVLVSVAGLLF